jgi:transposase-like protein
MQGIDSGFLNAAHRAAMNLRHGGDDAAGFDLAQRILSDTPLSRAERQIIAELVNDRLLPERRRARPSGDTRSAAIQMAAAREYLILTKRHGRNSGKRIGGAICDRVGVKPRTLADWVAAYRRNMLALNAMYKPEGKRPDTLQAGGRMMRQLVRLNSN